MWVPVPHRNNLCSDLIVYRFFRHCQSIPVCELLKLKDAVIDKSTDSYSVVRYHFQNQIKTKMSGYRICLSFSIYSQKNAHFDFCKAHCKHIGAGYSALKTFLYKYNFFTFADEILERKMILYDHQEVS